MTYHNPFPSLTFESREFHALSLAYESLNTLREQLASYSRNHEAMVVQHCMCEISNMLLNVPNFIVGTEQFRKDYQD